MLTNEAVARRLSNATYDECNHFPTSASPTNAHKGTILEGETTKDSRFRAQTQSHSFPPQTMQQAIKAVKYGNGLPNTSQKLF